MAEIRITERQEQLLRHLSAAHSGGAFELSYSAISLALTISEEELRLESKALAARGLMEKGESADFVALTPLGLRLSSALPSVVASSNDVVGGVTFLDDSGLFEAALARWPEVVSSSNLTTDEKARLLKLGAELFSHPASLELVRRAIKG